MGDQGLDDADMGKAARGAAAERKPDHRPPRRAKPDLVGAVGSVPAHHSIQHSNFSCGADIMFTRAMPPHRRICMVYALRTEYDWTTSAIIKIGCSPGFQKTGTAGVTEA